MKQSVNIFWFRRDLRLEDNVGFYEALNAGLPVLPFFIFDSEILEGLPKNDARVTFIHETLQEMRQKLESHASSLALFHDTPEAVFKSLIKDYTIDTVFTNHDYEPYAKTRDTAIEKLLNANTIHFKSFKDQVIYERNEITKADGLPYKVYTPYSRKWLEAFHKDGLDFRPSENHLNNLIKDKNLPNLSLKAIGFTEAEVKVKAYTVTTTGIQNYEATRNFPAQDKTSRVGPHLRFGTISVRKLVDKASREQNITFLKELIWREFFMQILWHFPHTPTHAFKPKYDRIEWRNNEVELKKWCAGETGYPLVDAGMRQLNQTGFMHNRVRMLVGSFLCKHLLIDWRLGEAYFALKLHDYELSSNVGNWQWVAGSGVDASPYFRIFNPTTQIEKFDKQLEYIKKWVPDFQELTYPQPIVDHKEARARCLRVYKEAVS